MKKAGTLIWTLFAVLVFASVIIYGAWWHILTGAMSAAMAWACKNAD